MKHLRLLEKKRNISKLKKDFNIIDEKYSLQWNIREAVKEELALAINSLKFGIYQEY